MGKKREWPPMSRRTADTVALCAFVVFLVLFLVILFHASQGLPTTATTINSTLQVVKGPHGVTQSSTQTTQRTTSDIVPSIWVSLLGRDQTTFLICGAAILAAYLLAAILQRVLLGKYAISVGPLSVPEITQEAVKEAADAALSAASADGTTEPGGPPSGSGSESEPQPVWLNIADPNLTLAGWRIDLEREVRRIATQADFPEGQQRAPLRRLLGMLANREIIPYDVLKPLDQLLTFANEGVHGAKVDADVVDVIRTQGFQFIRYLQGIDPDPGFPIP